MPNPNYTTSFKNEASKRFYGFFNNLFEDKKLSKKVVGDLFGFAHSRSFSFWNDLKNGDLSVSVEHILLAKEHYDLNPAWLLGLSNEPLLSRAQDPSSEFIMQEAESAYQVACSPSGVGVIIDEILKKHEVQRGAYAEKHLGMGARNLQKIIANEVNPSFATVQKIAEDMGESLDVFRSKPLPKGHLLELLKEKEERIKEQSSIIRHLLDSLNTKEL